MPIDALIVSEADAGGRTTTERNCIRALILRHEMNIRESGGGISHSSSRVLDNALQRDLVPRFNLHAAMETVMDDRAVMIPDFAASLTQ